MSAERHEKWVRVQPGTVIPAGQPYRVERPRGGISGETCVEYVRDAPVDALDNGREWFIDSSWKPPQCGEMHPSNDSIIPCQLPPHHEGDHFSTSGCAGGGFNWPPLVLPTEPTWGIPIAHGCPQNMSQWYTQASFLESLDGNRLTTYNVTDFIPLTEEQVQRIEAAR